MPVFVAVSVRVTVGGAPGVGVKVAVELGKGVNVAVGDGLTTDTGVAVGLGAMQETARNKSGTAQRKAAAISSRFMSLAPLCSLALFP